jgi:MoaA/NifB/PqqE/SkfB family radical SAM enzyme
MLKNLLKKLTEMFVPLHFDCIQVEVSSICNASCPYCVQACHKDQWRGGLMEMGTFERLKPDFNLASLVFLQGWGEPLLHPKFWQMVQMVKSSGSRVGFTTNGTRLDGEGLSKLLDSGVDTMGVSLAGIAPETHERFRKGCDFGHLDAALRKLKEMKQGRNGQGPSVNIAFMLLRSNWQELGQLPLLAAQWGVSQIVVSHLNLIGSEEMLEESLLAHPELWPEVVARLEITRQEASDKGIALHYHMPDLENPCPLCTENVLRTCFVSYRGDVSPCVMTNLSVKGGAAPLHYFQDQAYALENLAFGNINETSLREIWNAKEARGFRADFEKRLGMKAPGMRYLPAPCQHCYKLLER